MSENNATEESKPPPSSPKIEERPESPILNKPPERVPARSSTKREERPEYVISRRPPEKPPKRPRWITKSIAEELSRELFLKYTLIESLLYVVFLTCSVIHGDYLRTHNRFHMHTALTNHFINQKFSARNGRLITFREIKSADDVFAYMKFFVELLHNDYVYDQNKALAVRKAQGEEQKILWQNHVVGVARIRQLRVNNETCDVHPMLRNIFRSCYSPYDESKKSKERYGPKKGTAWVYSPVTKTESVPFEGHIASFGGDGYYQDLSKSKEKSLEIIKYLEDNFWITRETRVIFMDVSLYNANLNIFCVCKFVFEFPHIGGVIPSKYFHTVIFLHRAHRKYEATKACAFILHSMAVYLLLQLIREVFYFKWRILKQFWSYIDVAIIVIQCILFYIYITHHGVGRETVKKLRHNRETYGNVEFATYWYITYKSITAMQLFFVYMKIFKYLNFNKAMGQLNYTIKKCRGDFFAFSIMFFIVFFAFSELGYLLFGEKTEGFRSFTTSMFTLLRTILGDFEYSQIQRANKVMAPIFFICYVFFIFFVLINMFIAIVNDSYADVKTEMAMAPDELQMSDYIMMNFFGLLLMSGCCRKSAWLRRWGKERRMSVGEIYNILAKCGFTDQEIEAFFLKYLRVVERDGVKEVVLDKLEDAIAKEEGFGGMNLQSIKPADYFAHQEKIEEIDHHVGNCSEKLKALVRKMVSLENVKVSRRTRPKPKFN